MILFIMLIVQKVSAQTRETAARLSERVPQENAINTLKWSTFV